MRRAKLSHWSGTMVNTSQELLTQPLKVRQSPGYSTAELVSLEKNLVQAKDMVKHVGNVSFEIVIIDVKRL
jgi:hypothetical protein